MRTRMAMSVRLVSDTLLRSGTSRSASGHPSVTTGESTGESAVEPGMKTLALAVLLFGSLAAGLPRFVNPIPVGAGATSSSIARHPPDGGWDDEDRSAF